MITGSGNNYTRRVLDSIKIICNFETFPSFSSNHVNMLLAFISLHVAGETNILFFHDRLDLFDKFN